MKGLLVCDFDGTLYRKGEERQLERVISLIQTKKIPFAVASGRPWHMLRPYFETMLEDVFLISNDGALVTKGEQVLYSAPIDREPLLEFCSQVTCDYVAYGALTSYLKIKGRGDQIRWRQTFRQHAMKIGELSEIEEPIYKIFMMEQIKCPPFLSPTYQQFGLQEFGAQGTDKKNALSWLSNHLDISLEDCFVFGDGTNDIGLFSIAGHSCAMEQAPPKVKHRANGICVNLYEEIAALLAK